MLLNIKEDCIDCKIKIKAATSVLGIKNVRKV